MNPDSPKNPRADLEAQLTALILGELPAEQAFVLGRAIEQDVELAKLYQRLKQTVQLVRETEASPTGQTAAQPAPLKLSEERRQKLLAQFKTVKPKEFDQPRRREVWLLEVAAVVAILGILAAISLPSLSSFKSITRLGGQSSRGSVTTTTDQTIAGLAADTAVERAKVEMLGKIITFEDSRQKSPQVVETLSPNEPAASTPPSPSTKQTIINSIVLPPPAEHAYAQDAPVTTDFTTSGGSALLGPQPSRDASVLNGDETKLAFRSELSKRKGGEDSFLVGDPEWISQLETPTKDDSAGRPIDGATSGGDRSDAFRKRYGLAPLQHTATNRFLSRYASIDVPGHKEGLDTSYVHTNYAGNLEAAAGLLYDPKAPVALSDPNSAEFRYYLDLNGNGRFNTAGVASAAGPAGGAGGGGTLTVAPPPGVVTSPADVLRLPTGGSPVPAARLPAKGALFAQGGTPPPYLGELSTGTRKGEEIAQKTVTASGAVESGVVSATNSILPLQQNQLFTFGASTLAMQGANGFEGDKVDRLSAGEWKLRSVDSAPDGLNANKPIDEDVLRQKEGATNVYNFGVAGYVNVPLQTNPGTLALNGWTSYDRNTFFRLQSQLGTESNESKDKAPIRYANPSPIVLPSLQQEASLPHEERSKDVAVSMAPAKPGIASTPKDIPQPDELIPPGAVDFRAVDLNQVLKVYAELENRTLLHPSTSPAPAVTLNTQAPLTKREAVQALDAVLALNGIAMINVGEKTVKAVLAPTAGQEGEQISKLQRTSEMSHYVTHVVQLQHASPSELVQALQPLSKMPNSILPIEKSRILVLRESPENVRRMLETIAKTDVAEDKPDMALKTTPVSAPIPQPEIQAHDNPFSTFSLNVSDVSFKLAGASLEKGVMPEAASVRSEEFINAFDYRDPEPPAGVPVAFAWERAGYPFAQNRDLLRFSIKTAAQGREPGRPLNIVLLLDNSGSMERADRVRIIHEALRVLASQLQPQDMLSVVTFSRTARLWVDGVSGDKAGQVAEGLSTLTPEGGTNLEEAMNLAYQTAARHYLTNGINRVVLLTDGAANLGNVEPEALKQKVEAQRKQGIALDCFGIGWEGFNDDLLEILSRNGDGRYGFINTPEEAATEFAGQLAGALHVAASDVKVQVEFNPSRVTSYRQIGYAKHQLTKEQFRDNTVDAAEIGAAEAGNALYTVEVNPRGEGPLATVRVRYKVPGTTDYHEHEWAVPYMGSAVSLEQASPATRLAATASAFSEWLVSSPYAGEVSPDRLLGYLSGVPEVYGADARPKKLEWMIRQAKSISGK